MRGSWLLENWLSPEAGVTLPRVSTDRRLQELKRKAASGDREAAWELALGLYQAGERRAGSGEGEAYRRSLLRAGELEGFTFLDVKDYACGGQTNDVARFTHEATGLVFCLIPGGSFLMGSPEGEEGRHDAEGPRHEVRVEPFLLCETACTQAAWEGVSGEKPSDFKGPRRPVEEVSWDDAQAFCEQVGLRLPSEAEWEYACRAGTTTPFAFGETITPEQVNYNGRYPYGDAAEGLDRKETTEVGSLPANAFGLFEVHGNVWEWCQDAWHDSYDGAPPDGSAWEDAGAPERVYRGGRWLNGAGNCRSANRVRLVPGGRDCDLGFRPTRSLP